MLLLDVTFDMGGYDPNTDLFEPLQKLLDQCKSAKVLSKYATTSFIQQVSVESFLESSLSG